MQESRPLPGLQGSIHFPLTTTVTTNILHWKQIDMINSPIFNTESRLRSYAYMPLYKSFTLRYNTVYHWLLNDEQLQRISCNYCLLSATLLNKREMHEQSSHSKVHYNVILPWLHALCTVSHILAGRLRFPAVLLLLLVLVVEPFLHNNTTTTMH